MLTILLSSPRKFLTLFTLMKLSLLVASWSVIAEKQQQSLMKFDSLYTKSLISALMISAVYIARSSHSLRSSAESPAGTVMVGKSAGCNLWVTMSQKSCLNSLYWQVTSIGLFWLTFPSSLGLRSIMKFMVSLLTYRQNRLSSEFPWSWLIITSMFYLIRSLMSSLSAVWATLVTNRAMLLLQLGKSFKISVSLMMSFLKYCPFRSAARLAQLMQNTSLTLCCREKMRLRKQALIRVWVCPVLSEKPAVSQRVTLCCPGAVSMVLTMGYLVPDVAFSWMNIFVSTSCSSTNCWWCSMSNAMLSLFIMMGLPLLWYPSISSPLRVRIEEDLPAPVGPQHTTTWSPAEPISMFFSPYLTAAMIFLMFSFLVSRAVWVSLRGSRIWLDSPKFRNLLTGISCRGWWWAGLTLSRPWPALSALKLLQLLMILLSETD